MTQFHLRNLHPLDDGVPTYSPLLTRPVDEKPLRAAGGILRGMGIGLAIWIIGAAILWVVL